MYDIRMLCKLTIQAYPFVHCLISGSPINQKMLRNSHLGGPIVLCVLQIKASLWPSLSEGSQSVQFKKAKDANDVL